MADKEHLEILRTGAEAWNRWRAQQYVSPDLNRAGLRGADLRGADLSYADLRGADLNRANLYYANLSHAHLGGANLSHAHLRGADLRDAYLSGTNLRGANLRDAILRDAHLNGADLSGANLEYTMISFSDLREARGLEKVNHFGPSSLSVDVLQESQGQIPAAFLKGCGLTDWEIEAAKLYNPNITEDERTLIHYEMMRIQGEQPIMQARLFISYSHDDKDFVDTLEPLLDGKGIRYWRDVHDMRAGRMESQVDRGIALNPLVLLILSEHSVESDWVELEAATARELEQKYRNQGQDRDVLCPIALDDAWKKSAWPRALRRQIEDYLILDFSGWKDPAVMAEQFQKLYEGILLNYP